MRIQRCHEWISLSDAVRVIFYGSCDVIYGRLPCVPPLLVNRFFQKISPAVIFESPSIKLIWQLTSSVWKLCMHRMIHIREDKDQ